MSSHVPMKESDSGEGASWVVQGAQSVMPHHTTASVHWLGQGDKSNSLCLAATILMKKKKTSKHGNSQVPQHPHSKYLYLPLNQQNGSWMGSGSIFVFSPFYPQFSRPPPPPSSTKEPRLLSASSQATMSRQTTGE